MALQYTKSQLENISKRLQCCAADAAMESLTGEVFLDHEKETCGWNKFKFLTRASKILKDYIPGGLYTYDEPFVREAMIDTELPGSFICVDSAVVEDINSPFYGFSFIMYHDYALPVINSYLFVIRNGELHSVFSTADYAAPYFDGMASVTFDSNSGYLVLAGNLTIQRFDPAPLLNDIPLPPIPLSNMATPPGAYVEAGVFNYINNESYFIGNAFDKVIKYNAVSNTYITITLPVTPSFLNIALDYSTGRIWVSGDNNIYVIDPYTNAIINTIDISVLFSGFLYIGRLTFDRENNRFLVPIFDGGITGSVKLFDISGVPYPGDAYTDGTYLDQAFYYPRTSDYIITYYNDGFFVKNGPFFSLDFPKKILFDRKNDKLIVGGYVPFGQTTSRIHVFNSPYTQEELCLTDNDVQTLIETAQKHCCDCCGPEVINIDYDAFSNSPLTEASEQSFPEELFTLYYGKSTNANLGKADPAAILTLTAVNRYTFTGTYNYYVSGSPSYLYFAVPVALGIPNGFYDAVTGAAIAMQAPYILTYLGISYRMYQSVTTYTSNISLKVI